MKIPCVKKKGLKIFKSTADERAMLGNDVFFRTHYESRFHRYRGQDLKEIWLERDILDKLVSDEEIKNGNRVFILYGAAGSGKSETIRWLEKNISTNPTFRISRTELDPVKIVKKLRSTIEEDLDEDILLRWDILKNKPVTLANSLVWNSLNDLLDKDEHIIPITYKLRPIIEKNLRESFIDINNKNEFKSTVVELISREDLDEVIENSSSNINIDYEQFRYQLVNRLEEEILGGYNFVETVKYVGEKLYEKYKKRPILFIDDLVQSINIYSSDLLDFFITLEEGNWDIVIGLTPASFEESKRGRDLLTRINYLDTFDDRLYKLWLTDEFGNYSYSIDKDNIESYIKNYMIEFKRINGYECNSKCSNYNMCKSIQWNENEKVELTPLNKYLVQRIFDSLFKVKGQARHFIVTTGEYLEAITDGNVEEFLEKRVKREKYVNLQDRKTRMIIESLIPFQSDKNIEIEKDLLKVLGVKYAKGINASVIDINCTIPNKCEDKNQNNISIKEDPENYALKKWIDGENSNKELLKSFKVSFNNLIKELSINTEIMNPYISKVYGVLKYERIIDKCKIPIYMEGIDNGEGINIARNLNEDAIHIKKLKEYESQYQEHILNKLLSNKVILKSLNQHKEYFNYYNMKFEKNLNIKSEELSFLLYVFLYYISDLNKHPIIFNKYYQKSALRYLPEKYSFKIHNNIKEFKFIEEFFKDWFQLRDNFYDGFKLHHYITKYPNIYDIIKKLSYIKADNLDKYYKTNNKSFKEVIESILVTVNKYNYILQDKDFETYCTEEIKLIDKVQQVTYHDIIKTQDTLLKVNDYYLKLGKILDIINIPNENTFINDMKVIKKDYKNHHMYIKKIVECEKLYTYKWFKNTLNIKNILLKDYEYFKEKLDLDSKELSNNINENDNMLYMVREIVQMNYKLIRLDLIKEKLDLELEEELENLLELIKDNENYKLCYENIYYLLKLTQGVI